MEAVDSSNSSLEEDDEIEHPFNRTKRYNVVSDLYEGAEDETNPNTPKGYSYGDRFIPQRCTAEKYQFNKMHLPPAKNLDLFELPDNRNYWKEKLYSSRISNVLSLQTGRVMKLAEPNTTANTKMAAENIVYRELRDSSIVGRHGLSDWLCAPRFKPLSSIMTAFSLALVDGPCSEQMADWAPSATLALLADDRIVIAANECSTTQAYNISCAQCISYSPCGRYLAIGRDTGDEPILDVWTVDPVREMRKVELLNVQLDLICIRWTNDSKQILIGFGCGTIYIAKMPDLNIVQHITKHNCAVIHMTFSLNMTYLATVDSYGNVVILNWATGIVVLCIPSSERQLVTMDWHPWQENVIAIITRSPASITILNVETKKVMASYQQEDPDTAIHTVSFNKLSGELLIGVSRKEHFTFVDYKIFVLSALDRVVEILQLPEEDVRFMAWNRSGTYLATTSSEDTITIWRFCLKEEIIRLPKQIRSKHRLINNALKSKRNIGRHYRHPIETAYGSTFRQLSTFR